MKRIDLAEHWVAVVVIGFAWEAAIFAGAAAVILKYQDRPIVNLENHRGICWTEQMTYR